VRSFQINPLSDYSRDWAERLIEEHWGAPVIISRGVAHRVAGLSGFVAQQDDEYIGLVTYCVQGDDCEMVSLDSLVQGAGVGSALTEAVKRAAVAAGCKRLWLITTNDNTAALRFYQKRGFFLVAVHRDALERSRNLKPEIPLVGIDGIPLRDEIELEMMLT
jgi:ribosomal protein S18 acetylase RimI-like enzyme